MLTPQQMSSFNAVLVERLVSLKLYLNSFYIFISGFTHFSKTMLSYLAALQVSATSTNPQMGDVN